MSPHRPPVAESAPGGSRRVLRVLARMNVGGPARHVLRITGPLAERGWRTTLVTGRAEPGVGELVEAAREVLARAGGELQVLPGLGRAPALRGDLASLATLRRLARRGRFDVIHTHTAKAGVLGRLAGLGLTGTARVHSFHGHVLSGYFGPRVSGAIAAVERALAARTDALVAVSAAVRDELLQHGVGRASQYHLVPPGIDAERTAPDPQGGARLRARLGLEPHHVLIGAVGRLAPIKRPLDLLEAFARLAPRRPEARLLLVGDGPLRPAVQARLATLPGVAWLPPRDALGDVYAALDLVALPSAAEGLPQAVVEARAAGLPVLASAVGGVPELLRHEVDGLLLPPGDPGAWTEALAALCADAPRRARMAAAAREVDLRPHGAEAVARRLATLYDGLAGAPRRGSRSSRLSWWGAARHPAPSCTSSS